MKSTSIIILTFLWTVVQSQEIDNRFAAEGTFWKGKSQLALSFSHHSGMIEYGIQFGGGPLGARRYELGGTYTEGFRKLPIDTIAPPFTDENYPTDSSFFATDRATVLQSQLTGGFVGAFAIFNIPSPWEKLKPIFQLDFAHYWIKDSFMAKFRSFNGPEFYNHDAIYRFRSIGIGFRPGIEYNFGDIYFLKFCIGQTFYIPFNEIDGEKQVGAKYLGLSTYEESQPEFRIAFGFFISPERY
jgi:hypothetical protein